MSRLYRLIVPIVITYAVGLVQAAAGDDLIAVWHFDAGKGTLAMDSAGHENDATVHGARWGAGLFGGALEFDGVDDYVTAPGLGELLQGSVEAWVKFNKAHDGQVGVVGFGAGDGGKNDVALLGFTPGSKGEPTNVLTFSICGADWQGARSKIVPVLSQWYHLVGTWDQVGMKLYLNGTLAGTSAAWRGGVPVHPAVLIGAGAWRHYLAGTVDEVRVYQRALTEAEVLSHYTNRQYVLNPPQVRAQDRKPWENCMRNSADFHSPGSPTAGIQEAIDSLPRRGGCVVVPPGTFLMKRSIHLRSSVSLRGGGAATILRRPPQVRSALARSAKPGDTEIEVASPQGFEGGCEVSVMDQDQRGWYVTHAIVTQIKGGIFVLDHPLKRPYDVNKNAVVINYFPVLAAQAQSNISIEDITIDGDLDNNPGPESDFTCAAIHFWNVADSRIMRCAVRNFPSDGIGLQGGSGNHVTGCLVENCRGQGFHPGTGLKSSIFTDNVGRRNTGDGLYFCMEVEHSVFSNNVFHENKASGIGGVGDGGDRHNIITNNVCFLNGQHGINAFNGADNSITNNICKDNSQSKAGAYSGIILRDTLRTSVVGNRCLDSQDRRTQRYGIEEVGKSDYNLITSNHCLNNLQGGITTCGPHTVKAQNLE